MQLSHIYFFFFFFFWGGGGGGGGNVLSQIEAGVLLYKYISNYYSLCFKNMIYFKYDLLTKLYFLSPLYNIVIKRTYL